MSCIVVWLLVGLWIGAMLGIALLCLFQAHVDRCAGRTRTMEAILWGEEESR